jgi:triacylglycerol lipase
MQLDKPKKKAIPVVDPATQLTLLTRPEENPTGYEPFEDADSFPFEPASTAPSRVNVWWLADASWLAYMHSDADVRAAYSKHTGLHAELLGEKGTDFTIASNGAFTIVAFRGTQPDRWADIFSDVRWIPRKWDIGHVHHGFAEAFEVVWLTLQERLNGFPADRPVWFTGHSLGAALATLAAWRFKTTAGVCTFGSPLVGNQVFTGNFNARFGDRSLRYVNDHDIVTRVPPEQAAFPFGRYAHVDAIRWIDREGHIGRVGPSSGFFSDVIGDPAFVLHILTRFQALGLPSLPDALRDHTPLHYALHVWNDFATHAEAQVRASGESTHGK